MAYGIQRGHTSLPDLNFGAVACLGWHELLVEKIWNPLQHLCANLQDLWTTPAKWCMLKIVPKA